MSEIRKVKSIPDVPGNYQMTLEDLASCYESGKLQMYENNRGMMVESHRIIDKISRHFHQDSFGTITCGMYNGKMTVADGHHRIYGVVAALKLKLITTPKVLVMVKVITPTEFLRCYTNLNDTLRHTTNQDVTNPDMRYGDVIFNRIKPTLVGLGYNGDVIDKAFAGKRSANLAYVIDALDRHLSSTLWCYTQIYRVRKSAAERFHVPASESKIKISSAEMDRLSKAVAYYLDYLCILTTKAKKVGISLEGINTNASWFGLILTNLLSENCKLPRKPIKLAEKTIKRVSNLSNWVRSLGGGDLASIASNEPHLWRSLGLNRTTKNWIAKYGCDAALPKHPVSPNSTLVG